VAEPQLRRMTQDEFLAWQKRQDRLYELVDGAAVLPLKMMTGASQAHDRVVVNIIAALHRQLRGSPCRPTTDDLAVREPRAIIEVLSPSTMSFDRIRKLPEYQTIASVAYILLVDTERPRVDLLLRTADGTFRQIKYDGLKEVIELPAIQASLKLADIFEGLSFADASR
jgi:Uma2 family endonuclease